MKILLIEDDPNKKTQLCNFLSNIKEVNIIQTNSYKSGLRAVVKDAYDLVILDMSMPTFDITINESGGRILPFAGKEILRQMKRRNIIIPTIVVTQFEKFGEYEKMIYLEELNEELAIEFSENYIDTVNYNPTSSSWIDSLKENIKKIGFDDFDDENFDN